MRRLSLDHLTVADASPSMLAELAARTGCAGMCAFVRPMDVLPAMPEFELIGDTPERRATRDAMRAGGVALDLAYPFTLGGRTDIAGFEPALETVAWLGGASANVLCYDREIARRHAKLAAFAELAGSYGIGLAIEFYAPSQVRTLADALATIEATARDDIGVTLDLLHLVRSGARLDQTRLAIPRIHIAQLCDGPADIGPNGFEAEAGRERMLPGEGAFDGPAFLAALPGDVKLSVEVPRQSAIDAGIPMLDRARAAVDAARSWTDRRAAAR